MSKLKEMKKTNSEESENNILYTVVAGFLILFAFVAFFVFVINPSPPIDFDALEGDGNFKGSENGEIKIVEFSDFQCPACQGAYSVSKRIVSEYSNNIKFTYRHFPLTNIHSYAQKAAEASECAADQGKFWEMHDLLFENNTALSLEDMKGYADEIGVDSSVFVDCVTSGKKASKVAGDFAYGASIGINSTPTFFIDGQKYSNMSYETFKSIIENKLK